ncbi:ribose-5-phosphate isomerase RpiA [Jeotgalibacillus proteolyticus]|uniref:Ribose-5-phosphate isomerase A n=1 Tax=Jeotgalibacillus proteolyticus TaxID=2082395 RepID=A0A2S5GDB2_9BACL|nr:ribose-5-phosphate isomerase RpiA [Jeotgalibacillus proteolyticus]PPA70948.1 ribose 5-phosphate isomerase A [Jeotgalibacillus proteolyticus]
MEDKDFKKKLAGEKAAEFVKDGMVVGLGSGSTMYWTIKKIGEQVSEGIAIQGIPSSVQTANWAKEFGIPLTDFSKVKQVDLAIDGADEIDQNFDLIKGGGGSLVREKIIDSAAGQLIIAADDSKLVKALGAFPLPVEVVPFGYEIIKEKIARLGSEPVLRSQNGKAFVTDNGNYILDCLFSEITDPKKLHNLLKSMVGVVETGLFINMTDMVIIGKSTGTEILHKSRQNKN